MNFHQIRMFVLIWATLLFSVRVSDAETGSSVLGEPGCPLKDYCNTLVEGEITAEAGLCVVIPCSFTVPDHIQVSHIVWFKCEPTKDRCGDGDMIFHTNTYSDKVQSEFKGRVSLLESDVSQKNCSIVINDLKASDSGTYQHRVDTVPSKGSYTFPKRANVSVKGLSQRPTVMIPPLTEGRPTTLTCTAPGLCSGSEPTFTWRWRGRGESDAYLTGNITAFKTENVAAFAKRSSSTLSFSPSAEHHGTNITCTVIFKENVSTEETATLNVTYSPKHVTVQANPGLDVKENVSLTLSCTAESNPPVRAVTWMKTTDGREEIVQQTQTQTFRVNSASPSDSGLYSCEANNYIGRGKSQPAEVKVRYSPKHVTVQANPGLDVKENVLLTLSCTAESNPPVSSVTWRKTTDGREEIVQQTQTQTFRVNSASPSDSGLYSCEATNDIGSGKSQPAEVKVRFSPKHTNIMESAEKQELDGRSSVMLSCISHSFPPVHLYSWYRKSQGEEKDELVSEHQNHTVYSNQSGVYYCIAQNEVDQSLSDPVHLFEHSPKHVTVQANPGLDVKENVLLTLSCTAESNPAVRSVTWRKTTDGREEIVQQTQTQTFRVNSASPSDSGLYSCEATNDIGRGKSQPAEVKVRFAPKHTNIMKSSEKQELDGRSSVMLSCISHSFPPVHLYSWYRKSQGEEKDELVSEHQNHTVYSNQSGVYYCVAQNEVDQSLSDPVRLFEHSPKHVTVQANPGLDVNENVSLTLSCTAESNPPVSSVTWRKTTDGREEIVQQTQTQTFRVNSASPSDSGLYSCEATNDIGSGKSQPAEVKVRFAPKHTNIMKSAEKQELDGRSSVMLSCISHSFPPVQLYSWFRKSQGEEKDKLVSEHQNHTVYSNQSGVYYCVAQNEVDQSLSDPVRLFEHSPKHVTVQANPGLDVKENVSLTLSCTAESNPPVSSVTWRKMTDGREEIVQQTQTQTFRVNSASPSDSGLYSCEATNDIGSGKSQPAEVKVRYPPTKPILSMSSEVTEGQTITVNCTAESFPQSTLTLTRTNTNNQAVIITENNLYSRPINSLYHKINVTSADAGWYVCRAQNSEGSKDSKQKELVVKYSPKHVTVQANPGLDVKENVLLTLSCTAESNPPVSSVTWRKTTDGREEIIQQTQTQTFRVNSASPSDSGLYSCEATNDIGSGKSQPAEVKVRYSPKHVTVQANPGLDVKENVSLTLSCTAESNPPVSSVTWMKTTDGREEIVQQTQTQTFRVNSASPSDSGLYSCEANNYIGRGKSQPAEVKVRYSPKHVTVQANPGLDVKENVLLTLSCTAESNPPVSSVTWRKTTDGREEIVQQTQTQTFRVNSASPSDSGLYSCEATNDIGSGKSQPAEVKVRFSPKHTNIMESAEKQELDGRSSVMLSCISHSFPPVHLYSWYRKSQGEEKDELVSEHQNHTVYSNQSGVYYCIAQNEVDQSLSDPVHLFEHSPKHVTVQANPGLDVKENVLLTLSCTAESNPPVSSVTWRKTTDGREEIVQQTQTFRVNSASPSDSGLYSCEATNDIGSGKSQPAEVKVRYSPKHVTVQANPGLDVKENVLLTLSCTAESNPPVSSVTWRKTTDGREEIDLQTQTQTFRVNSASPSDSGLYSCEATNDIGSGKSQPAEVKVRYKPRKTSISVSGSSDNQVKVGRSLTLTCDTDANPAPTTYSWYRSKNQQTDSWWKNTNRRSLRLTIQRADEACYRCSASNLIGRGDESQPVCIQVLYPPTEPILYMSSEVTEGQTITVSCTAESFPQSTLTLMRINTNNQALIITENNIYSRPIDSLYHTFTVTSADAGWYFCRAQNSEGSKDSKQQKLVVKYKPRKTSISVSGSSDNQVKVGRSLTLTCDTDANPALTTYSWYRSKNQRTDSWWNPTNRRMLSLTIQRADEACYRCSASNLIGRGDESQPVCIQVLYPPTEPILSMRSEVTEGQTITVSCSVESFPQSTLTLMRIDTNHQSLKITENNLNSRPINSLYHTFTVTSADAGWYVCRAQNSEGSKDSEQKTLVVKYSPKHVTVQANPGLDVKENVSLTLSCTAESNPPVSSVTWRKTTDGREEIVQQTRTQTFRVNSASPSDSGLYSCEATNDIGRGKSQPAEVKVRFSPKHTNITESAEQQELDGRSSVMLSCISHSFPPVQLYSWYRKSQGEEKDKLVSEHQNHTVYSNQPGVYYCVAQNEVDQSLSDPVHLFEHSPKHVTVQANPGLDVKENVSLTLSCTAESNPPVSSVTWRKTTDGREEIVQQTRTQTFRVNSASPSDSGLYSCEATNDIGSGKSQPAEVKVRYPPTEPKLSMRSEVTEGQTITVNCTAESFPQSTLTLTRTNTNNQAVIITENNLYSRPINSLYHKINVTSADAGWYFCRAQNSEGSKDSKQKELVVKYSPKHVTVQANPGLDVKENVSLTLSCTAESNPPVSSVTWRKTTDGREEIVQQTQTQTFRVNSASPSDSGLYSCEATNDIGSGKSQPAEVKVRYPPTEPKLFMRSEVTEGQTITVTCTVESFPQSTLTLMRININHQSLKITENNLNSRPINSLYHKINVTSADAGWYVCRAQNSEGSKDSKQKKLVVKYPPTEPKLSMRSEVTEGQTITVTCTVESFPQSTLTLMRINTNHQSLKITENNLNSRPINSLYHKINVTSADAGLYVCRAQNSEGSKDSKQKKLVVKYPPTEPLLFMRSEVTEGQTITVNCTVESFPQSTLTLMRINTNHQSLKITENNLNSRPINSLYHKINVTSADAGLYVCRAQNSEGSKDSKQNELVVKYPPTEPILSMSSEVTEGQTITVSCTVESFPQSTLTLMRINTNPQSLKIIENNLYSRPINSLYHNITVTSADAGWYFCRAQNSEGSKDSKQQKLVVKYPPTEPILTMRSEVTEGQTITVTCSVESFPQSTLTLMRIDKYHQSLKIIENNLNSRPINSLYHKINVTSADAGWYFCRAQNSEGSKDSEQKKLVVKYPPTEPKLSMRSEVTEGQTITVNCTVESFPQSTLTLMRIDKYHQSSKITENNLNSRPINSLYHKITVTSADAGLYVCRAQNSEGSKDSKQKKLVVKYPPTEPLLSMRSEVTEGQTITVTCSVESFPQSNLTLMRIDKYHQSLKITENNLNSRPINSLYHKINVTSADAGWYVCRAQNSEGSKDSKQKELVVKFSPKHTNITESAEKQELDGRSSVMLSCISHSFPPVHHYSWFRKSQGEEKDEIVSEHQNHTVYSNQPGVYYCVAENEVNQSLSDPVHLFEHPPTEPKLSMSSEVTEGQTITVNCTVESFPQSTLTLMRTNTNPQALKITDNNLYSRPINSLYHTFTVTSADAGLYFCRALNSEGSKDSKQQKLVVKYPPTEPILSMRSEVTEGQTITVTCTVESFPQSTLTLMRINTNHQAFKIIVNKIYSRPINSLYHKINVTSADAGWYVCRAQNSEGSKDSKKKELVVKYPPTEPILYMRSEVTEGRTITVNCTAESFPQSTLTLMRIDKYHQSSKITENNLNSRPINSLYHTFTVTSADAGWYFCRAQNSEGSKDSKQKKLVVKYPPTEPKLSMRSEVTEGRTIRVTCTVESFPQSNLTLMRIDKYNQSLKITGNNLNSRPINSLSHKINVTSADAGWYVCRAQNSEGSKDSKQKKLVVKYSPKHVTVQANPGLDVKENVLLTLSCTAESNPPVSSVTWRKTTDEREEIVQQTQTQTFTVNSASPSDSGLYSCEATNDIGSGKSQPAEVKVRFSPKHTNITESAEKQELDGRSSVMLSCISHSFPPVHLYSWYRKSQGEEKEEIVSEHQNHTVYSNQSGVYYCVAENEVDRSLSDPVHLFEPTGNYLDILKFLVPALFVLMIIILIIVVLRFRKKKSIQQGTTNTKSPSGFSEQLRRPGAQRRQPLPDSTPPTDINAVYCMLNLPQAASAQNPTRHQAGNTEDDSVNYASLHFKNKIKKKQRKVEEDPVYAKVSKPTRVKKNEPESLQDYENTSNVTARAPTSPNLFDNHTSEGEVELQYSQVRFTARPRR
ncbi:hemicentin-1-like [Hippoglossus hippoglossus]|uniref:hemicentin-1-like n=1 Tax=Hippoglossus hippoglossus TaxID=8267 RepID=UPI00148CE5C3|nr:hemicentin-1-like [Hippoglossus hippoglossus]